MNDRGMGPLDEFGDEVQTRSNKTRFLVLSAVIILALGYMISVSYTHLTLPTNREV